MIYYYLCSSSWWVVARRSHSPCLLALPPESFEVRSSMNAFDTWDVNVLSAKEKNGVMVRSLGSLIFFCFRPGLKRSSTFLGAPLTTCLRWMYLLGVAWQEGRLKEWQPGVDRHPIYQPFNHSISSLIKHPINTVIANGNVMYIHGYGLRQKHSRKTISLSYFTDFNGSFFYFLHTSCGF